MPAAAASRWRKSGRRSPSMPTRTMHDDDVALANTAGGVRRRAQPAGGTRLRPALRPGPARPRPGRRRVDSVDDALVDVAADHGQRPCSRTAPPAAGRSCPARRPRPSGRPWLHFSGRTGLPVRADSVSASTTASAASASSGVTGGGVPSRTAATNAVSSSTSGSRGSTTVRTEAPARWPRTCGRAALPGRRRLDVLSRVELERLRCGSRRSWRPAGRARRARSARALCAATASSPPESRLARRLSKRTRPISPSSNGVRTPDCVSA